MRDVYCAGKSGLVPKLWSPETSGASRYIAAARLGGWLLFFGLGYFLTARLSQGDLFQRSRIGLLWAPNALLLSALVLTSRGRWWLIFAAASIAHALALGPSTPAWRMAWQLPVHAAFVIATVEALRRFVGFPIRFDSRRVLLVYVGLAMTMSVSIALTAPGFVLSFAGVETLYPPEIEFLRLFLANLTPALLVVPAALLAAPFAQRSPKTITKRSFAEVAPVSFAVLVVGVLVFCSAPEIGRLPWLLVLSFPPLIWAALRWGPLGASLSLLSVGALSIAGAAHDLGPFVANAGSDVVFAMLLYWVAISIPVLLLAAVIRERELAVASLDDLRCETGRFAQMAAVGELSRAIGNELSQPLTAILANAPAAHQLLARWPIDEEELRACVSDVEGEGRYATQIINEFRSLGKMVAPRVENVDVAAVVRAALGLSKQLLAQTQVEVQTQIDSCLPAARLDRVQLLQVMVSLIANSCDSMRAISDPERRLRVRVIQRDPKHVEIVVADTGVGLPNGDVERVFEPFFSTKREGLGLGLPIARSFAVAHGGAIWAENNAEGGATFHLVLSLDGPPVLSRG